MNYFPIFVDAKTLDVLIVGGGEVATRKMELLLKTPASITVVSPDLSNGIAAQVELGRVTHLAQYYDEALLPGRQLVFVATSDSKVNQQISKQAKQLGIFANVVDSPELCHFITPSIIDRSPMVFAISSEGDAPVLVRYWRERLETLIPNTLGSLARFSGRKRKIIKGLLDSVSKRRAFWERFFLSSKITDEQEQEATFNQLIQQVDNDAVTLGELYVVEAPTNSDRLSLAALRYMQQADFAFFNQDVGADVIELIRRDAETELVDDVFSYERLSALLEQGERVCILSAEPVQPEDQRWKRLQADYVVNFFASAPSLEKG
ncbi:NAD(P)-dependent oxidoreductase [Psychrobium sp. 1_MG-2023]|nr:NAD(P)-dependent oxidoreductase [Psychrobium sp. 1_MG-2023]